MLPQRSLPTAGGWVISNVNRDVEVTDTIWNQELLDMEAEHTANPLTVLIARGRSSLWM